MPRALEATDHPNEHLQGGAAHALAQGGKIVALRTGGPKIAAIECYNRDGHRLTDCTLATFQRLKARRLIASSGGAPYRITREGLHAVRAQRDSR